MAQVEKWRLGDWQRLSLADYVRNDLSVGGLVDGGGEIYRPEAAARLTGLASTATARPGR